MKYTGITRPLDKLGRVVLPKEIRKNLDLQTGDEMEIFTANGGLIVIRKAIEGCFFCGTGKKIKRFKNTRICEACSHSIGNLPPYES